MKIIEVNNTLKIRMNMEENVPGSLFIEQSEVSNVHKGEMRDSIFLLNRNISELVIALGKLCDKKEKILNPNINNINNINNISWLFRSIQKLNLGARIEKCLFRGDVIYIGQLVQLTERELLMMIGIGRKTLKKIKHSLKEMNLSLGIEIDWWLNLCPCFDGC